MRPSTPLSGFSARLRGEGPLLIALLVALLAYPLEHTILAAGRGLALFASAVLIAAILGVALRVAHHAEALAERYGEPYGTMILTISAVLVEVVILAIMLSHNPAPTLVRDTIYSALMLDINGILGLAALLGGLRHGEQAYNVDSGNTYLTMILCAVGVSMIVPEFIPHATWQAYSIFNILIMLLLYGLFLRLQTGRYAAFFSYGHAHHVGQPAHGDPDAAGAAHDPVATRRSAALLVAGLVLIGALSEVMAKTVDAGLAGSGVPAIVPGLLVALISASPEILTALRAALDDRMQPVVNIALGASLSTVILTVPVIEALALFTGQPIEMALTAPQTVMVLLTLLNTFEIESVATADGAEPAERLMFAMAPVGLKMRLSLRSAA